MSIGSRRILVVALAGVLLVFAVALATHVHPPGSDAGGGACAMCALAGGVSIPLYAAAVSTPLRIVERSTPLAPLALPPSQSSAPSAPRAPPVESL